MVNSYKLTEEIKQFILQQKKANPKLSCRDLIPLIKEHFQIDLSKSLVNNVIKQNNLSSPRGRRGISKSAVFQQPFEKQIVRKEIEFMENGGCFFLKAAELKFSLTSLLAENLSVYFPNLSTQSLQGVIEASIYLPLFKNKNSLWLLLEKEFSLDILEQFLQQLAQIPFDDLNKLLIKLDFDHKVNKINGLDKTCLLELNSFVQEYFCLPEYQFFDFFTMQERLYSLPAKIEKKQRLLPIQLFYPRGSLWVNDVIWHEGFSYAADKVNKAKIFNKEGEQIWISPSLEALGETAFPPYEFSP